MKDFARVSRSQDQSHSGGEEAERGRAQTLSGSSLAPRASVLEKDVVAEEDVAARSKRCCP
eukprot:4401966-Heterocapsa_arctica.AAC.1